MVPNFWEIYIGVQSQLWHLWVQYKIYFLLVFALILVFIWEEIQALR
jgi:hypothetical protein